MKRPNAWIGAGTLLAMFSLSGLAAAEMPPAPAGFNPVILTSESVSIPAEIVEAPGLTVVYYDASLPSSRVLERHAADAERLGFPVFKTLAAAGAVVLRADREQVAARLAAVEGLPIRRLGPGYRLYNDPHPDRLIAFTSALMVRFAEGTTETAKEIWYRANGYTRVRELPTGQVLVETHREPSAAMREFASKLVETDDLIIEAVAEFAMTGKPTNSDSIQATDPLLAKQWPLAQTGDNTNFPELGKDEDLDAPRAWMLNQRNARDWGSLTVSSPFGRAVVGIFDSGTELTHPDLAANIDSRVGIDFVDAGQPSAPTNVFGLHGTLMAGLIAGNINGEGIVGVAPGATIYTVRVFAEDYTTTNARLVGAINDTISRDVDVNVHPYILPIDTTCSLTSQIEGALRASWESGRRGTGLINIAAAGNFFSQVAYPASSEWAVAVGATGATGQRITRDLAAGQGASDSNWGGNGIDFVMPSYTLGPTGTHHTFSMGIVTTDFVGSNGRSVPNVSATGNTNGDYTALGPNTGLLVSVGGSNDPILSRIRVTSPCTNAQAAQNFQGIPYLGTSAAAAHAAGVVALMVSDARYTFNKPFAPLTELQSRSSRRDRAQPDTLLGELVAHADLPGNAEPINFAAADRSALLAQGGAMAYIDQYNEFQGFGRPNPARFLAFPTGWKTPDSFFTDQLEAPIYEVVFDGFAEAGAEQNPELADGLRKGWRESSINRLVLPIGVDEEGNTIDIPVSPYMTPLSEIYFENGDVLRSETVEGTTLFPFAWTDSLPLRRDQTDRDEAALGIPNRWWNPFGRYQAGRNIGLFSPQIQAPTTGTPLVLKMQIGHQLGNENASSSATGVSLEFDYIAVDVIYPNPDNTDQDRRIEIARITGDSSPNYKPRPVPGSFIQDTNLGQRMVWPEIPYRPWVMPEGINKSLLVREYSFYMPPFPEGTSEFSIELRLVPGPSFLPEYDTATPIKQLLTVERDNLGFVFYSMSISPMKTNYAAYLARNVVEPADGFFPTWAWHQKDLFVTQNIFGQPGSAFTLADPSPSYLIDRANPSLWNTRQNLRYMDTTDRVVAMKANPKRDIMAYVTRGAAGDLLYLVSNDGINARQLLPSSQTTGARDLAWSANGTQLLFAARDYVRLVSLGTGDEVLSVETPLSSSNSFLTDFRSPVITPDGGLIVFAARRGDAGAPDRSLQLYTSTRSGRVISYNEDPRQPFLAGWEGIDMFDFDLSSSGRRLVFVANAEAPPDLATGTGALASEFTRIFTIDNFHHVTSANAEPQYVFVPFRSVDDRFRKSSARYPRISPDGREIVWAAYSTGLTSNEVTSEGRIVRQPLTTSEFTGPAPVVTPTPTPVRTPTPVVTQPPVDSSRITSVAGGNFAVDEAGWTFGSSFPVFDAPRGNYSVEDGRPAVIAPGVLAFSSAATGTVQGNNVLVGEFTFRGLDTATSPIRFGAAEPYRTTLLNPDAMPIAVEYGNSEIRVVPAAKQAAQPRLFIVFPNGNQVTRDGDVTFQVRLDAAGANIRTINAFITFDPMVVDYRSGMLNTTVFNGQVRGGLNLVSNNSNYTFGTYQSPGAIIRAEPDSLYLFRARVRALSASNDPARMPSVRLRANSATFESAVEALTQSVGSDLSLVPTPDRVKTFDLLFRPPAVVSTVPASNPSIARGGFFSLPADQRTYTVSVDLLNFMDDDDPNGGIRFDRYEIYRLDDLRVAADNGTVDYSASVIKSVPERYETVPTPNRIAPGLWESGPGLDTTPYDLPEFVVRNDALAFRVLNKDNTFGFWALGSLPVPLPAAGQATAWINEIARTLDVSSTPADENGLSWIEIAGPSGLALDGYRLVAYRADGRTAPLLNGDLTGRIPDGPDGFGTLRIDLRFGSVPAEDPPVFATGIALIDPTATLVQFLSHAGDILATNGPLVGQRSTTLGTIFPWDAAAGRTYQLAGYGTRAESFRWNFWTTPATPAARNTNQFFRAQQPAWVNEIHHRNFGDDLDRGVEIAGRAGFSLAGWRLISYLPDGTTGSSINLSGSIPNESNGFGALWFPFNNLRPESGAGVALVGLDGEVHDFVGYGAAVIAGAEPATGLISRTTNAEPEDSAVGSSLQMTGAGITRDEFRWNADPIPATRGRLNTGQSFLTTVYKATFTVRAPNITDPVLFPSLRARLLTRDFQRVVATSVVGGSGGATVPLASQPRDIEVYMVLENNPVDLNNLTVALDVLSFFPDRPIADQTIEFTNLRLERLVIPGYPATR